MGKRRMISNNVIDTDLFMELPLSAQALYFHLCLKGDDDGFIAGPRRMARLIGASDDDLRLLLMKRYLLAFEDGVVVIKHWRLHNLMRSDRYIPTDFQADFARLFVDENNEYELITEESRLPDGCQPVVTWLPQDNISKVKTSKDNLIKENKRFTPPTIEEVRKFIQANDLMMVAEEFHDYYESKGWKVGNAPMKSWEAACRNWARREKKTPVKPTTSQNFTNPHTDDELDEFFRRSLERAKL